MSQPGQTFRSDSVVRNSVQALVEISLLSLFFLAESNCEHYATWLSGHQKSPVN